MDLVAKRYGQRPSSLAGFHPDDPVAFDFDVAIAARGLIQDVNNRRRMGESFGGGGGSDQPGVQVIEAEDLEPGVILRG